MTPGTDHDQLVVNNTATLGGTLELTYIAPFTASAGNSFIILTAGTLTGTFSAVNFPDAQTWFIDYDTDAGTVTVGVCPDGDINGDGCVNLPDVLLLAQAWGTCQGDPDYNPDADLNGDNCVNLPDVLILASHWGECL